jgi:signal transduction histidine kinase
MNETTLDAVRLRFHGELEQAFREDYFVKSLKQLRFGIALATLIYALFGMLDAVVFPHTKAQTWFIRYVIVCPICALTFLFTYSRHFRKYMQIAVVSAVLVGGGGIIAMMVIVRSPVNYFHFAGLLLVIMYTYTFSKLRFLYTALAAWMLVGLYEIATIWIMPVPRAVFMNDHFFFIAANLIGMFSCYHRELYLRKDFCQSLVIKDLVEKKHSMEKEKIFRDLHDGIGGITTNISLLAEVALQETTVDKIKKTVSTISDLSREGLTEIRNIMHSFDATRKTWETMAAELRRQGHAMIEPHGIFFDIKTSLDAGHKEPDSFLWLNLFRIYKEALTNVMKHSKAKTVCVDLTIGSENLLLSISDDGVGIRKEESLGRGIANMTARAREIGGSVNITSDKGTRVCLKLPLLPQYSSS